MAESIRACEEASTDLYLTLEASKLLKESEIEIFKKKRRQYEYDIRQSGGKNEQEYLRYINYDTGVLDLLKRRKENAEKNKVSKSEMDLCNKVETMLTDKINLLYLDLVRKYPRNLYNWAVYLEFCKKMGKYKVTFEFLQDLVKVHVDKPLAFAYAADWIFQKTNNHELARTYILQGIHSHKQNQELYIELLKIELNFTASLKIKYEREARNDMDSLSDSILNGENCRIIYEFAKKNIGVNSNTMNFYKQMLGQYEKYDFTKNMRFDIIRDILKDYPENEMFQDLRIRTHLNTLPPYPISEVKRIYKLYEDTLGTIYTEQMCTYALNFLLESIEKCNTDREVILFYLISVRQFYEKDKLSVKHYLKWVEFLTEFDQQNEIDSLEISFQNNSRLVKSPDIWVSHLKNLVNTNSRQAIYDFFKKGVTALQDKALPLYLHFATHVTTLGRSKLREIYELGVRNIQYPEIYTELRILYLNWIATNLPLDESCKFYKKHRDTPPYSLKFHQIMYELEISKSKLNIEFITDIRRSAAKQFGKNNVDVWIDYLTVDLTYNYGKNIELINKMATDYLHPSLELLNEYTNKFRDLKSRNIVPIMSITEDDHRSVANSEMHSVYTDVDSSFRTCDVSNL